MASPAEADNDRVFAEPWEARAFALAVALSRAGAFSWSEWTAALAKELETQADDGTAYYQHWLRALEKLCAEKELASQVELRGRKEE